MGLLYGRAGRLTALFGGFRPRRAVAGLLGLRNGAGAVGAGAAGHQRPRHGLQRGVA
jgi:hypothetical protein